MVAFVVVLGVKLATGVGTGEEETRGVTPGTVASVKVVGEGITVEAAGTVGCD